MDENKSAGSGESLHMGKQTAHLPATKCSFERKLKKKKNYFTFFADH